MDYIIVFDGQIEHYAETMTEARNIVRETIQDCYSKGDEYHIYKKVCTGSSTMPVKFKNEED